MRILPLLLTALLVVVLFAEGEGRRFRGGRRRPQLCANGKPVHRCYVNPCHRATCAENLAYICRPYYCGGCFRTWKDTGNNNAEVQCNDIIVN